MVPLNFTYKVDGNTVEVKPKNPLFGSIRTELIGDTFIFDKETFKKKSS